MSQLFFVLAVKALTTFGAEFKKEHGVSILATQMVNNVYDIVLFDFLSCDSSQSIHSYIWVAIFLLYRPNTLKVIKVIDGKRTVVSTLCISHLDDGTLFSSWIEGRPLLVRT